MTPRLTSRISRTVGFFIVGITGVMYITQLLQESGEKVSSVGLAAFAVIGALSGLCFALVSCLDDEQERIRPLYAGEKFFHACLLIIQTVFIRYYTDYMTNMDWIKNSKWITGIINLISIPLLLSVGLYATYFCVYAFGALNDFFWERYEKRLKMIKDQNKQEQDDANDSPPNAKQPLT